jgi:hypothetical protein
MAHVLWGLIYGVHMGIGGPKKDMAILMNLNHNGQAITLSKKLADKGAVDVASLGETFGFAVRNFSETNGKLMANLQRIEQAIEKSMTRSDEQLAYYVAQAREMIDLSISSQKDVLEALQQRQSEGAA